MTLRSFALQALLRAALVCAAFYVGFIVIDARAQQPLQATTLTPTLSPGNVEGRLTSTQGRINFPFFLGRQVGSPCDPFVDYNCEVSEAAMKAAQEAAVKAGKCDPYLDYKCLDTWLGDSVFTRFFRYYQLEWGKAVAPSDPNAPPSARDAAVWPKSPVSIRLAQWRLQPEHQSGAARR
jgi:hypothetical protein